MKLFKPEHLKLYELKRAIPLPFLANVKLLEASVSLISIGVYSADHLQDNHHYSGNSERAEFSGVMYHQLSKSSRTMFQIRIRYSIDWDVFPWAKATEGLMVTGITREGVDWINPTATKLYLLMLKKILPLAYAEYVSGGFPKSGKKSYRRYLRYFIIDTIDLLTKRHFKALESLER